MFENDGLGNKTEQFYTNPRALRTLNHVLHIGDFAIVSH